MGSALALSALRFWLLPEASRFREQLQSQASDRLGATVRIGSLSARMLGLEPQLVLRDLSVVSRSTGLEVLRLSKVGLGVSLLQSLLQRSPVLTSLRLEEANVLLERGADGSPGISGLSAEGGPPLWLLALDRLTLRDIELTWRDREAVKAMSLGRLNLSWRSREAHHRLSAVLQLVPELGSRIALAADLSGAAADPSGWQGGIYLKASDLQLGTPLAGLFPEQVTLRAGASDLELWGQWAAGGLASVRGRVELARPAFALAGGGDPLGSVVTLDSLVSRIVWQRTGQGWELALGGLSLEQAAQRGPPVDLALALEADAAGGSVLRAAASDLRLEDVLLFRKLLPPGALRKALDDLQPAGVITQPEFVVGLNGSGRFGFCGGFRDLVVRPWGAVPGAGPLRGSACGSDRRGLGRIALASGEVEAPRLWPHPVALEALEARWRWERESDGLRLDIPALGVKAPGLQGSASGQLRLPPEGGPPFVDLQARLFDVDARRLRDYLPLSAMPETTARWLRGAFSAGRIDTADVLLRGLLAAFPFRGGEGVFQARAQLENVELMFNPDWPPAQGLSAQLDFQRAGMDIIARGAVEIGGVQVQNARAHAGDLDLDPWLLISGNIPTDVRSALEFLEKTPLRQIPQRVFKYTEPSGPTDIDLKLSVYLPSDRDDVRVDGKAALKNALMEFPDLNIGIRQLNGTLKFSETGLKADGVKGTLLGSPVSLGVGEAGDAIRVELKGEAGVEELHRLAPAAHVEDYLKGASAYRLVADIPKELAPGVEPMRMMLESRLDGLAVLLPAPIGKPGALQRSLRLELAFPSGEDLPMRIVYGPDGLAELWFDEHDGRYDFGGGDILVGRVTAKPSRAGGLRLHARVGELDATAWRDALARIGRRGPPAGLLKSVSVQTDDLRWDGRRLGPMSLKLSQVGSDWKGSVDGAIAQGDILLKAPQFGYPLLKLDLNQLSLPDTETAGPSRPTAAASIAADSMPALQVRSRRTQWRGMNLGALTLQAERWTQGLNVKELSLAHENHRLQLKGSWLGLVGTAETRLEGTLDIQDLGLFLTGLGFGKEIRDTPTQTRFALAWPGAPQNLSAAGVRGSVDLQLGRGSVLNMEPGLGRALAVLNLDSLKRLLLLDFSDMFGKGLSYDSMRGRFELGGGQARNSRFLIDAATGTILISGRVGLVAKDLDETVTVIPHTLASLPMSGVMLGSAAVGAALSVAGKLVGQGSVSIASNRYAIKGSWDDPQVTRSEGNMPLDVLNRAWSGLKDFSGFGSKGEEGVNE